MKSDCSYMYHVQNMAFENSQNSFDFPPQMIFRTETEIETWVC